MFTKKTLLCLIALICIFSLALGQQEKCGKCMTSNGIACISNTQFRICLDGENPSGDTYTCGTGKACSNTRPFCGDDPTNGVEFPCKNAGAASCNAETPCGTDESLRCLSRTEFGICVEAGKVPSRSTCSQGLLCSDELYENANKICGTQEVLDFLEYSVTCDGVEQPETTTPPPPTPEWINQRCTEAKKTQNFFYTFHPDDDQCHKYLYCEKSGAGYRGIVFTCPNNGHWNIDTNKCQATKPANCKVVTTTSSTTSTTTSTTPVTPIAPAVA